MSEAISAPALVYCNCTTPKVGADSNESNFEIYRYLTVDPEGDRNIFCTDYPYLFEDDCKPYVNIVAPFPMCKSEYYGEAVRNLLEYVNGKYEEAAKQGDMAETNMWSNTKISVSQALESFTQQQIVEDKCYPCICQVVDRWFNTSKEQVNNYFTWSTNIKKNLIDINSSFGKVVAKAKKKLKKAQPSVWKRIQDAVEEFISPKIDDLIYLSPNSVSVDFKKISRRADDKLNETQSLSWFDDEMKKMRVILESVTDLVDDEVFFTENQEYVNTGLEKAKDLFLGFQKVVSELDYEDDLGFNKNLDEFKNNLDAFKPDTFNDQKKSFLTRDSFLVCRCGGIINIVYDNNEITQSFNDISRNIIELFKWIESDLHELIYDMPEWMSWQIAESDIDAFNFVRYVLLELKETSQYDNYLRGVYNGQEVEGFGVEMNITIQSRSVINKKTHNKKALMNLVSFSCGVLSFKLGTVFSIVTSAAMQLAEPSPDNVSSVGTAIAGRFSNESVEKGSTLASAFLVLKSLIGVFTEASYSSVADYVGEIQVVLRVGAHDITYARSYDITGEAINQPERDIVARTKPRVYFDPSQMELVNTVVEDIRNFDNIINVDTTLAADVNKVEKIKKEYIVDEDGINEK